MDNDKTPRNPQRRVVLLSGGAALMSAWLSPLAGCKSNSSDSSRVASDDLRGPDQPTPRASFLQDAELRTLQALVDRLIPEDVTPGAAAAGAEQAIDGLLAAFLTDPPLIYSGGPYSDRGGAPRNDFARFIPLDDYETLAWRIVIEGSQGLPEREFNGPVRGLQQIYTEGLAHLDARASQLATGVLPAAIGSVLNEQLGGTPLADVLAQINTLTGTEGFADLPALLRDVIRLDASDPVVQELVNVAFPNTLEGTYGPPEYGGNKNLVGWTSTNWPGDVHPRGFTDSEVIHRDNPGLFDSTYPPSYGGADFGARSSVFASSSTAANQQAAELPPLIIAAGENLATMIMNAEGSLAGLRRQLPSSADIRPEWVWRADHA